MAVIVRMPSKGGSNTKNVTAVPDDVLSGKVFVNSKGEEQEGNMPDNGAVAQALNAGGSYVIPKGYHDGNGKVTANSLAAQTQATATADTIGNGKTAWVNGNKVTGKAVLASEINGVKKDYYVYAGQNVKAGDFVQLTSGVSGVGAGTAEWKNIGTVSTDTYEEIIKINNNLLLYCYYESSESTAYFLKLVKIDGIDILTGPDVKLPYYDNNANYRPWQNTLSVCVVDDSHFYFLYNSNFDSGNNVITYNYCTISGTSLSIESAKRLITSSVHMYRYNNFTRTLPKISDGVYACIGRDLVGSPTSNANATYYVMYIAVNNSTKTLSIKTNVSTGQTLCADGFNFWSIISDNMLVIKGRGSSGSSSDDDTYIIHAAINGLTLSNVKKTMVSSNVNFCDRVAIRCYK